MRALLSSLRLITKAIIGNKRRKIFSLTTASARKKYLISKEL